MFPPYQSCWIFFPSAPHDPDLNAATWERCHQPCPRPSLPCQPIFPDPTHAPSSRQDTWTPSCWLSAMPFLHMSESTLLTPGSSMMHVSSLPGSVAAMHRPTLALPRTKPVSTTGPLHVLFSLPGMLCPSCCFSLSSLPLHYLQFCRGYECGRAQLSTTDHFPCL